MTGMFLSEVERRKIAHAVARAEAQADAEIVTIIARASDSYGDVALAWAAGIAVLALAVVAAAAPFYLGLIDRALGLWAHDWSPREVLGLALAIATAKFGGMWLILRWRRARLALTPGPIRAARVQARAQAAFRLAAQGRTRGATGVVIYLSMAERRAVILADAAIAGKVAPEIWGDAMHALLEQVRAGHVGDGMVAAVRHAATVLTAHFPRAGAGDNQLPDGPIEL